MRKSEIMLHAKVTQRMGNRGLYHTRDPHLPGGPSTPTPMEFLRHAWTCTRRLGLSCLQGSSQGLGPLASRSPWIQVPQAQAEGLTHLSLLR